MLPTSYILWAFAFLFAGIALTIAVSLGYNAVKGRRQRNRRMHQPFLRSMRRT
jgi:hypothetical protein